MLDHNTALVILSGGQDSTTCLFDAASAYDKVHAITFDYGQRHSIELQAARRVWALFAEEYPEQAGTHSILTLGPILRSTSPLVSDAELEQYADHQSLPDGIEKTFVPMRNMLFLTIAANIAVALRAGNLVTGVCEEDYGGYPDCRQTFITATEAAINEALGLVGEDRMKLQTPLMSLTKAATVLLAMGLKGCYAALGYSHTAYDGQYPPYGKDHATLLREKGFEEAGFADPLWVRAAMEGREVETSKVVGASASLVAALLQATLVLRAQGL